MLGNPIEILLAEDDIGDVKLTEQSLKNSKLFVHLNHVPDGVEAMKFLNRENEYANAPTPDLILLDLNMPKKSGREVLEEMKKNPRLRMIPVVILTTSDSENDIVGTYDLGANCFITKPVDFNQFQRVVNEVAEFWFTVVKLPSKHE